MQSGDTLSAIAGRYGVSRSLLVEINGLTAPDRLVVGQALLILVPERVYTVREGDTLYSVSAAQGVPLLTLLQNNPGTAARDAIYPGQTLVLSYQNDGRSRSVKTNGYAYPFVADSVMRVTLPYLTRLTIFGYGFTEEGELIYADDTELIEKCRAYRTSPIMLISSITEGGTFSTERAARLFNSPALTDRLLGELIDVMRRKGYVGLDSDFEYIKKEDAEAYFAFLRKAADLLHAEGWTLNVDLAPKTRANEPGLLYEAHNYEVIGGIADSVLLMTYEYGYTYGPPMAVAPLPEIERVVNFAVTQIPPEKIFLGIPNYGYDWQLPYVRGTTKARSIGNGEALDIAYANGAEIIFDERSQSPYFNYTDGAGNAHVVWFEDVRSVGQKFRLIEDYNLLGGGYWNVMRPFTPNWMRLSQTFEITRE